MLDDRDDGKPLESFAGTQLVANIGYWDIGPSPRIADNGDVFYIDFVVPIGVINTGDIRLSSNCGPAGSRVLDSDPDNGATSAVLHGGPNFAAPSIQGSIIRFRNVNGNTFPITSNPVYDFPDLVYLDMIVGGGHGHVVPGDICLNN